MGNAPTPQALWDCIKKKKCVKSKSISGLWNPGSDPGRAKGALAEKTGNPAAREAAGAAGRTLRLPSL